MRPPPEIDANPLKKAPVQDRAQRTIDTLLEAATQFIERDEDDKLTTNRIAERAGFSVGTLYQYFPNKEAILLALARRASHRLLDEMEASDDRAFASGKAVREIMRDNIHTMVEWYGRGPRKKRWLSRLIWRIESPTVAGEFARQSAERMAARIRSLNDPGFREPTPALMFVVTRAMQGVIRSAALEDSDILDDPAFEEELLRLCWNLLRQDPPGL